ncbi:MAG: DUF2764 domain-containing protein [Treponema sp.]|nr:DUF2764 domain-containing protein [Treponema sp.]
MGSYYYLVSQLPYLMFGQAPPMSSEAFRELARPLVSDQDAALLDLVSLDPQPPRPGNTGGGLSYENSSPACGSDFIDQWREWERAMRLNLAKHRLVKTKREGTVTAEPPVLPTDAVSAAAKAVAEADSPLEGETLIDRARWSAIEVLQGTGYFDSSTVFAYLLKLIILERRASFHAETGFSEYKSLYASILENVAAGGVLPGTSPAGESK